MFLKHLFQTISICISCKLPMTTFHRPTHITPPHTYQSMGPNGVHISW